MELLIHVNRRIKTRSQVQLPVEALLTQYQDPSATSFVTVSFLKVNFKEYVKNIKLFRILL